MNDTTSRPEYLWEFARRAEDWLIATEGTPQHAHVRAWVMAEEKAWGLA